MKRKKQKQVFLAWLLLLCLLPLAVTKITHRHEPKHACCCPEHPDCDDKEDTHDAANCSVCQFTLSPFLAVETASFIHVITTLPLEPVYEVQQLHLEPVRHYLLRAPPVV